MDYSDEFSYNELFLKKFLFGGFTFNELTFPFDEASDDRKNKQEMHMV